MQIYCLVMAGGKGTRFWPESTSAKPKQYLSLGADEGLLTQTLKRFDGLIPKDKRFVVTVKEQEKLARESGKGLIKDLIFEPSGRNTAPCILLSLAFLVEQGAKDEDVIAIVPSDHVILNAKGFAQTIEHACHLAAENQKIVTIGIAPHFPHTGYGYIHQGASLDDKDSFEVQKFVEKPDRATAEKYLASGEYFWNAGMFVAPIGVLKHQLKEHAPDIYAHFNQIREALDNSSKLEKVYGQIPSESIDYAVMEKSSEILVTKAQFDWNDLGSWDALEDVLEKKDDNIFASLEEYYVDNAKGNIVYAPGKMVALINVNDLIVVSNENVTMILPKKDSQKVKEVVSALQKKGREDLV